MLTPIRLCFLKLCLLGNLRSVALLTKVPSIPVAVLGVALFSGSAAAASPESEPITPAPAAPQEPSQATAQETSQALPPSESRSRVQLVLHGDALDAVALQQALTQELGREFELTPTGDPVTEDTLTVAYAAARSELVVSWQNDGQTITRVIATSAARVVEDSVLLASNLMHAQLDDLAPSELQEQPVALALPAPQEPVVAIPTSRAPAQVPVVHAQAIAEPRRLATAGLFYPASSNYDAPDAATHVDVNLLHGRVGSVHGLQLGGVNVVVRSGASAHLEAPDAAAADVVGVQLGYLANVATGHVSGVQLAGLFNHATGPAAAWQAAAAVNVAGGSLTGLQSAFLFNTARRLRGVQAGLVNLAGDVDGLQVGLVNVARKVRGVSVGLVNIAEDIEGVPIAPFSVSRTGGVHPTLWSGTSGLGNVGVKLSTRNTYSLVFGSYHRAFEREFFGGGFALGARVALGHNFYSDLDVSGTYLIAPDRSVESEGDDLEPGDGANDSIESNSGVYSEYDIYYHEQLLQPRLRAILSYRVAHHFGLFVGVAAAGQFRFELGTDRVTTSVAPEFFGGIEL